LSQEFNKTIVVTISAKEKMNFFIKLFLPNVLLSILNAKKKPSSDGFLKFLKLI